MLKKVYNNQYYLHLDMAPEGDTKKYIFTVSKKHGDTIMPIINLLQEETTPIPPEQAKSVRIYLDAHGNKLNNDQLANGNKTILISIAELVELLKPIFKNFNADNYSKSSPLLSLVICYAAGNDPNLLNSFAGKLHKQLAANGIYLNINARMYRTVIKDNHKYTMNSDKQFDELKARAATLAAEKKDMKAYLDTQKEMESLLRHQDRGSKYTFGWERDNDNSPLRQVVYDVYWLKDKEKYLEKVTTYLSRLNEFIININHNKELSPKNKTKLFGTLMHLKRQLDKFVDSISNMSTRDNDQLTDLYQDIKRTLTETKISLNGLENPDVKLLFAIGEFLKKEDYSLAKSPSFFQTHLLSKSIDFIQNLGVIFDAMEQPTTGLKNKT